MREGVVVVALDIRDNVVIGNFYLLSNVPIENKKIKNARRSGGGSLVERSLPIPEVHSSNPVIGKNLY